ncbi:hypothetical protein CK203_041877 [Vitis vinifera]|uniref:Uncharacterized protein n=1 Tax=Vitis vinifera TaxID=29760 RepID=A0A438FY95_VITVI|nr:hypothetical protein CK203_041877 [Vitis vinifera]
MWEKKSKWVFRSCVFHAGLAGRDRAAWLACPKDPLVDTVAENLLDRLEKAKDIKEAA